MANKGVAAKRSEPTNKVDPIPVTQPQDKSPLGSTIQPQKLEPSPVVENVKDD